MQAIAAKMVTSRAARSNRIVAALRRGPAWMPEISQRSGLSIIKTRNTVARLFDAGVIDITRQGFRVSP